MLMLDRATRLSLDAAESVKIPLRLKVKASCLLPGVVQPSIVEDILLVSVETTTRSRECAARPALPLSV